jgi:hypothetical protein
MDMIVEIRCVCPACGHEWDEHQDIDMGPMERDEP